ncbi:MAG: DNA gyrase/topoisomerase IV subunit A, partial [Bacteroidales bacterium]
ETGYYYTKRFRFEYGIKEVSFIGEHENSKLLHLLKDKYPRIKLKFGGKNKKREDKEITLSEFIKEKSVKAKGKRLTDGELKKINILDPLPDPEKEKDEDEENDRSQMSLEF